MNEKKKKKKMSYFGLLPEECISYIISLTSPKDACIASTVSPGFKSAADSNSVWERFLPPDSHDIIAKSDSPVIYSSKKELYFRLCDSPLLLDGGRLSFRLIKPSGKKCYMLCARELGIAWGDSPMYWNWHTLQESRFAEVAELFSVCWLSIQGSIWTQKLSLKTRYAAYLVFKILENSYGLDRPSKASVKLVRQGIVNVEGEGRNNTVYLERRLRCTASQNGQMPKERDDGWNEIELGEYVNDPGEESDILEAQFMEIESLHWKGGLIVEGIEIRPKDIG